MSAKRRRGGPYFTDNRILPRVRDYVKQAGKKYPHPEDVVEWLKNSFPEYARTSNNALKSTVEKALAVIEQQRRETPEQMYEGKKKSKSDFYEDDDDGEDNNSYDSSDSLEMDSNIQLVEVQDTNSMNAKLISTYQKAANPASPNPKSDVNMNNSGYNTTQSPAPDFIPLRSSQSNNTKPNNQNQNVFANAAYNPLGSSSNNVNKQQQNGASNTPNNNQQLSGNVRSAPSPSPSRAAPKNKRRKIDNNTYQNSSNIDDLDAQIEGAISSKISTKNRPNLRYSDLGGMEHVLQDVRELIERPITHPEIYSHLGADPPRGILLHGPPGCGKTMLAHAIAGELGVPFFMIAAPEIVSGMSGESEAKIRGLFNEAAAKAPSIIFIDEIDAITSKREQSGKQMEARIVAQLLTCIDQIGSYSPGNMAGDPTAEDGSNNNSNGDGQITVKSKPVIIIGATNRPDSLDSALRRAGRFDREISLNVPDEASRARILQVLSRKLKLEGDFDFVRIAKKTPGFVGADLTALTKEAASICINRVFSQLETPVANPNSMDVDTPEKTQPNGSDQIQPFVSAQQKVRLETEKELGQRSMASDALRAQIEPFTEDQLRPLAITMNDFELAIKKVQPSAKREGFATIPNVTWSDVGALDKIRKELEMAILEPIKSREKFEAVGLTQPCGVLLFGPPGCGKTLLAKAVANECQANFISVKGPELLNKYVGESERAIRQLFQRATASSPCIIFFDELDAIVPRRQGGENQVTERVVNQLLTELDGLEGRKQIFIVAATNRPDMIDSAMLRPGRLDKLLYVPLPSPEERIAILQTCLRHTPVDSSVNVVQLAMSEKCNGFSGADIASLVREASTEALRENIENRDQTSPVVKAAHFEVALTKVFPSVSRQDEIRYNSMRTQMVSSRLREVPGEEKAPKKTDKKEK